VRSAASRGSREPEGFQSVRGSCVVVSKEFSTTITPTTTITTTITVGFSCFRAFLLLYEKLTCLREEKTDTDSAIQDTLPDLRERTVELVKKNSPITLDWPTEYLHGCADCRTEIPENYTYCESCNNNHPETDNGPSMDDGPWYDELGARPATPTRHPHESNDTHHSPTRSDAQLTPRTNSNTYPRSPRIATPHRRSPTRSNNPVTHPREVTTTGISTRSNNPVTPPRPATPTRISTKATTHSLPHEKYRVLGSPRIATPSSLPARIATAPRDPHEK
jgi:hypothetical protein